MWQKRAESVNLLRVAVPSTAEISMSVTPAPQKTIALVVRHNTVTAPARITRPSGRVRWSACALPRRMSSSNGIMRTISRSPHCITFLHPEGRSNYDTLREKLHWNEYPSGEGKLK
jgi:NAD kinase